MQDSSFASPFTRFSAGGKDERTYYFLGWALGPAALKEGKTKQVFPSFSFLGYYGFALT
jgi:hypothetical protein